AAFPGRAERRFRHMSPSTITTDSARAAPTATLPAPDRALWAETDALLRDIGCDAETRAAAGWYAVASVHHEVWPAESLHAPESLRRLVDGQQQAERVWA